MTKHLIYGGVKVWIMSMILGAITVATVWLVMMILIGALVYAHGERQREHELA